jgi:hypothetical protein
VLPQRPGRTGENELKPRAGAAEPANRGAARDRPEQVEYVGGPRNGESETRVGLPSEILGPAGVYSRSVRCADDGAMRYVWRAESRDEAP